MPISKIRVIDIETTGTDPIDSSIIEIGSVDVGGDGISNPIESLVALEGDQQISPEAMAVHHITPVMLDDASRFGKVIYDFYTDDESVFAAHNAKFEKGFLPAFEPWICTYKCAMRLWPDAPSHSNQSLRYWKELYNLPDHIEVKHAHRALYDAVTTAMLLQLMLKEATIKQMIEWSSKPALLPRVPFGKHKGLSWDEVPQGYLQWMVKQDDMDENAVFTAQHMLDCK